MKQAFVFCFFFLNVTTFLHAQSQRNATWLNGALGWGNWATQFNTNNTITQYQFAIQSKLRNCRSSHSNICDTNGRVVLYSDGFDVLDSNNNILAGGGQLADPSFYNYFNKYSYSQASIFLPMENNIYYFINLGVTDACLSTWGNPNRQLPNRLYYHKIDMSLNGGAGKVYERMQILDSAGSFEVSALSACRHANGKDWWLVKQGADSVFTGADSVNFYTYLITQDSVVQIHHQFFPNLPFAPNTAGIVEDGQISFNNLGTQMAFVTRQKQILYLFDFDRCTGKLNNAQAINPPAGIASNTAMCGVCFSRNDRFIYLARAGAIFQYDTYAADSASAWYQVAERDTIPTEFNTYGNIYLANNNRIYIGARSLNGSTMSVINNPDAKEALCGWCPKCLRFDSVAYAANGIGVSQPSNMANYGLGKLNPPCEPLSVGTSLQGEGLGELVIYPNPSNSLIYIKNRKGKTKQLMNLIGDILLTTQQDEIEISRLASGIYLIRCEEETVKVLVE